MKSNHNKSKSKIKHVLVIDDDEFLLNVIRKKLELANYKITISNNVHDAQFKLGVIAPDLILLDIIMPEINGIDLMSQINSQFFTSKIPIILMSYLPKAKLTEMGYSIGSAHYLPKPFDVNTLPLFLHKTIKQL